MTTICGLSTSTKSDHTRDYSHRCLVSIPSRSSTSTALRCYRFVEESGPIHTLEANQLAVIRSSATARVTNTIARAPSNYSNCSVTYPLQHCTFVFRRTAGTGYSTCLLSLVSRMYVTGCVPTSFTLSSRHPSITPHKRTSCHVKLCPTTYCQTINRIQYPLSSATLTST